MIGGKGKTPLASPAKMWIEMWLACCKNICGNVMLAPKTKGRVMTRSKIYISELLGFHSNTQKFLNICEFRKAVLRIGVVWEFVKTMRVLVLAGNISMFFSVRCLQRWLSESTVLVERVHWPSTEISVIPGKDEMKEIEFMQICQALSGLWLCMGNCFRRVLQSHEHKAIKETTQSCKKNQEDIGIVGKNPQQAASDQYTSILNWTFTSQTCIIYILWWITVSLHAISLCNEWQIYSKFCAHCRDRLKTVFVSRLYFNNVTRICRFVFLCVLCVPVNSVKHHSLLSLIHGALMH